MQTSKPFPIPVVPAVVPDIGPGSQPEEEGLDFLPMPRDMHTFDVPQLPEPETFVAHQGAVHALRTALAALRQAIANGEASAVDVQPLEPADRALINQVLGEGEVAAQAVATPRLQAQESALRLQAQESVYAGLWRVLAFDGKALVADALEAGPFPRALAQAAADAAGAMPPLPAPLPAGTMNAPAVLEELRERAAAWRPGASAHVVNLSLLPVTPADSELYETVLGRGAVSILSRGYGNCRIVSTAVRHIWRVTYFNSQDMIILDTLEVGGVPEVACAAREDLEDSAERLTEVLQWVQAP